MKILSAEQIREADRATIEHEPISSIDLMERAATAVCDRICEVFGQEDPFDILCGPGNNGGDGWVVARLLQEKGYDCRVWAPVAEEKYSEDARTNTRRARELGIQISRIEEFEPADRVVVDAMFGSGLDRPLEGVYADLVRRLNDSSSFVIALDIPSGMKADENADMDVRLMVHADWTISLQNPKLAFFDPPTGECVGYLEVMDIGLDKEYIASQPTSFHYLTHAEASSLLKPRAKFGHKGNFGHALLVAGSHGKAGAAILAARGSLRSGLGLLTMVSPEACMESIHSSVPEAMVVPGMGDEVLESLPTLDKFDAVGMGPGLGVHSKTEKVLYNLIQSYTGPMVLDADALNILAENKTWMAFLGGRAILTPHPGEMDRLLGKRFRGMEQVLQSREMAMLFDLIIVLKGAHTAIIYPNGEVWFNSTGNNGMATAGSGDTLCGITMGLLAQGYSMERAALLAVYLHGLAGDLSLGDQTEESLIAGDLSDHLGAAFRIMKEI